jgi:hypothetical protein
MPKLPPDGEGVAVPEVQADKTSAIATASGSKRRPPPNATRCPIGSLLKHAGGEWSALRPAVR